MQGEEGDRGIDREGEMGAGERGRGERCHSRPIASSVSELLVAFILPNSLEPSSQRSSKPPATIRVTFALPVRIVSEAISMDCRPVALRAFFSCSGVRGDL
jgi:hypothetical protein